MDWRHRRERSPAFGGSSGVCCLQSAVLDLPSSSLALPSTTPLPSSANNSAHDLSFCVAHDIPRPRPPSSRTAPDRACPPHVMRAAHHAPGVAGAPPPSVTLMSRPNARGEPPTPAIDAPG